MCVCIYIYIYNLCVYIYIRTSLLASLCKYTLKYAILFFVVSLISLSVFSLFMYSNARGFCAIHYNPQHYHINQLALVIFSWCIYGFLCRGSCILQTGGFPPPHFFFFFSPLTNLYSF